ncbi:hypothetical protein ACFVX6_18935 [Streptomyces sp. NPDC058289]|uniref:hypothetical protein n=1 Tax=Streptomyces sp. NPDC058289 TaxID=3346425 RepID=UPI0036E104F5
MSGRTDNRHRVATICRGATGLAHHTCLKWAAAGLITRQQPVPDAGGAAQRAFEAQMVHALANALRDDQRQGTLLGFTRAVPGADGLVLGLHPGLADRVLGALLPRMDDIYGGIRGVPGLRLAPQGREWVVGSVAGNAVVRLLHPDADWRPRLPDHADGLTQLWRRDRHRLHPAEAAELTAWTGRSGDPDRARSQDWLLSRVLRRPQLLGVTTAAHGWANTYTHGSMDLVVEWCCAMEAAELEQRLRRSGLAHRPPHVAEQPRDRPWFGGEIGLGGAFVTVRRQTCPVGTGVVLGRRAV